MQIIASILLIPIFLSWGSFLNVVAYRALRRTSLFPASSCPDCQLQLRWHHLIPIFSWLMLRGRCAYCSATISWLYPFVEFITAVSFFALFTTTAAVYLPAYTLFFSALIVTLRTDLEAMLIMSLTTLGIIPVGILASFCHKLPISSLESIGGALLGAGFLWTIRHLFWKIRGVEGLGLGDIELLAAIGSFTGPLGVLASLLVGSFVGSALGLAMLTTQKNQAEPIKLPFGAFLALGAIAFVVFQKQITPLFAY